MLSPFVICVTVVSVWGEVLDHHMPEEQVQAIFDQKEHMFLQAHDDIILKKWSYWRSPTEDHRLQLEEAEKEMRRSYRDIFDHFKRLNYKEIDLPPLLERKVKVIKELGYLVMTEERYNDLQTMKVQAYDDLQNFKICSHDETYKCTLIYKDVEHLMETGLSTSDKEHYWGQWRDHTRLMKKKFKNMCQVSYEAAKLTGFEDVHTMETAEFQIKDLQVYYENILEDTLPLFALIQAYSRNRLAKEYDLNLGKDPIPEHLLGDLTGEKWPIELIGKVIAEDIGLPHYPHTIKKGETKTLLKNVNKFLVQLGFSDQTEVLEGPSDTLYLQHVNCTPLVDATHETGQPRIRIRACIKISLDEATEILVRIHHIQAVKKSDVYLKTIKRKETEAFIKGISKMLCLAINNPYTLTLMGLIDNNQHASLIRNPGGLSALRALQVIPALRNDITFDMWRNEAMEKKFVVKHYNTLWWDLRTKYMGVSALSERSAEHFDAGATWALWEHKPKIENVISDLLGYQLFHYYCDLVGQIKEGTDRALHNCDLWGKSTVANNIMRVFKDSVDEPLMSLVAKLTKKKTLSADAMLLYFDPAVSFLNSEVEETGWINEKPTYKKALIITAIVVAIVIIILIVIFLINKFKTRQYPPRRCC